MNNPNGSTPNAWLAKWARERSLAKKRLLVLAPQNDPFNVGTETQVKQAAWFASVYQAVGYHGIHLRRLHYRAYDAGLETVNGLPYPNTEEQWNDLQNASRFARYLGYADPQDFTDNRAPAPVLSVDGLPYTPEPEYEIEPSSGILNWYLPEIGTSLEASVEVGATWDVYGYDYDHDLQPNLIEVWSEKSGDDATLKPIAYRYGINYCPGIGFQSISNIRRLFQRVRETGKPTRILYISDFDPAGTGMPVQVGRQTQFAFWQLEQMAEDAPNVKLEPIALVHEQVVELQLPRKPIKEADLRKAGWEERFGEGAVEVDALEARHPGMLGRLVAQRVSALQDPDLPQRISEAREGAEERVRDAVQEVVERHRQDALKTVEEFNEGAERYRERLQQLHEQFEEEVGPIRERFEEQRQAFEVDLENLEVDIPDLPEGVPPDEDGGWMFNSDRDFCSQTEEFQRRQRKL